MLFPLCRTAIDRGDYPLRYDTVVKVYYPDSEYLRWSFFVCQSKDMDSISKVLSAVPVIGKVKFIPIEDFDD